MTTLWQDIRYGFRQLLTNPRLTGVVVLSLALGIGGMTTIFSILNAVLLRPLPYRAPDRLVYLWPTPGMTLLGSTHLPELAEQGRNLRGHGGHSGSRLDADRRGAARADRRGAVSASSFDLLASRWRRAGRLSPRTIGRSCTGGGAQRSPWARDRRDPQILGKTISWRAEPTVIGILPPTSYHYLSCEAFVPAAGIRPRYAMTGGSESSLD